MKSSEPQPDLKQDISQQSVQTATLQGWWLWLFLAILVLMSAGFALWRLLSLETTSSINVTSQKPAMKVQLSIAQAGTIEESSDFIATIEPLKTLTLNPKIQGKVTHIFVNPKDTIKTGSAIIQIETVEPKAQKNTAVNLTYNINQELENTRLVLKKLEDERQSKRSEIESNKQEYDKYVLLAAQGAVSRQSRDEYAKILAINKAALDTIDSKIAAQLANLSHVEKNLQTVQFTTQTSPTQSYNITAPLGGTITNIPVKIGDIVNTSTPIATIKENRSLEVKINVPSRLKNKLRPGITVEVMDAQGRILTESQVHSIVPQLNQENSIIAKALLSNPTNEVKTGEFIKARLIWSQRPGVLIPTTAVFQVAGESFVYVAETLRSPTNKPQIVAKQRRVKLGNIKGDNYQVLGGLQPQEKVIVSGLLNLRDGDLIIPETYTSVYLGKPLNFINK